MNATQAQIDPDVDAAIAEPPSEKDGPSGDAAAAEAMDRDDWLCRVGDVARKLREQRRAAEDKRRQAAADRD